MNKEELLALGLTDEMASKVADASKEELKGYIPKSRFDEVNEAKKKAEEAANERDAQIEKLSKDAGLTEELKTQIETLQAENKKKAEEYKAELSKVQMQNAIKLAINGQVHDEDMVASLLDTSKMILQEDGKLTGLKEQIETLKESKGFLFKADDNSDQEQGFRVGGTPPKGKDANESPSIKSALESRLGVGK